MPSTSDDAIRTAAIAAYGCADADIVHYHVGGSKWEAATGEWFALYVRPDHHLPWQAIGRRRTRAELFTLAQRGPPIADTVT